MTSNNQNEGKPAWMPRTWKRWLHDVIKRRTGLYLFPRLNRGWNLAFDMRAYAIGYRPEVFFDVGANIGQTVASYLEEFPEARFECFEPTPHVVQTLRRRFESAKGVTVHPVAVAAEPGEATFVLDSVSSTRSHLAHSAEEAGEQSGTRVEVVTVDQVREQLAIDQISLLKVDVEGLDYEVLRGANDTLAGGHADFVQVEVGMNPHNELHVPFDRVRDLMYTHGYTLFGLYDQKHEAFDHKLYLRRSDAVFVSPRMVEAYTPPDIQTL